MICKLIVGLYRCCAVIYTVYWWTGFYLIAFPLLHILTRLERWPITTQGQSCLFNKGSLKLDWILIKTLLFKGIVYPKWVFCLLLFTNHVASTYYFLSSVKQKEIHWAEGLSFCFKLMALGITDIKGQSWPNGSRVVLVTRRSWVRVPGPAGIVGGGSE